MSLQLVFSCELSARLLQSDMVGMFTTCLNVFMTCVNVFTTWVNGSRLSGNDGREDLRQTSDEGDVVTACG